MDALFGWLAARLSSRMSELVRTVKRGVASVPPPAKLGIMARSPAPNKNMFYLLRRPRIRGSVIA
jgi:hypothetical protein